MGSRQDPKYRLVVSESARTPRGSFLDTLGTYDPGAEPAAVHVDIARADDWIRKGAHPSETVKSLLERARRPSA
jgi:small subunit ribosomal protein S16